MPNFYVKVTVQFSGEIEAESEAEAREKAWTSWGDTMDNELTYDGVDDISVEELEDEIEEEEEGE
jgi:hypothetical protein